MQLKSILATYGRKYNLGDYNSAHVEISLFADLDEGDDEAEAAEALRQMARHQVMVELARLDQRIAAKVGDVFMGLPAKVRQQVADNEIPDPVGAMADDDARYWAGS